MTQRTRRYWFRLILVTLVMLGVGALIVIFIVVPLRAAEVMSYPLRMPVGCQPPADFGLHYEDSFPAPARTWNVNLFDVTLQ